MTRVEATATIGASIEQAWEFISNPERYPEWVQARLFDFRTTGTIERLSVSETPVSEGTVYHERDCCGPITFESEWQITDWEPPHRQVHQGEFAGVATVLRFRLEPAADGTEYRQVIDVSPLSRLDSLGGWMERWLARWLVAPFLRQIVLNLKTTVEAEYC